MFLSFRKDKEPKCISVQIEKKLKGPPFHFQKCVYQNICDVVEIMVFTTEGFLEVAIEIWPEWDLNPRPLNSVQTL